MSVSAPPASFALAVGERWGGAFPGEFSAYCSCLLLPLAWLLSLLGPVALGSYLTYRELCLLSSTLIEEEK